LLLLGLRFLEKAVYRLSNKIVTISEGMRDIIQGKGVPHEKMEDISF
jgi:predicted transcriptional regulator